MSLAVLVLPGDQGVRDALARLGLVTVGLVGPGELREQLAGSPGEREAAEVDRLAAVLGDRRG